MDTPPLGVRLAAEALGTFIFLFLGFSSIAVATDIGSDAVTTLGIAFAFGLGLAMAIAGLGHYWEATSIPRCRQASRLAGSSRGTR